MVAICSRLLLISAISLASWQMVLAPVSSHAATKVKTKTLIIPDEKAAESPAPESGIAIPDDALPDLESVSPKLPQEDPQVPLAAVRRRGIRTAGHSGSGQVTGTGTQDAGTHPGSRPSRRH